MQHIHQPRIFSALAAPVRGSKEDDARAAVRCKETALFQTAFRTQAGQTLKNRRAKAQRIGSEITLLQGVQDNHRGFHPGEPLPVEIRLRQQGIHSDIIGFFQKIGPVVADETKGFQHFTVVGPGADGNLGTSLIPIGFKGNHRIQTLAEGTALKKDGHPVLPPGLPDLLQLLLRQERRDVLVILHTQGIKQAGSQDCGQQQRRRDLAGRKKIIQS